MPVRFLRETKAPVHIIMRTISGQKQSASCEEEEYLCHCQKLNYDSRYFNTHSLVTIFQATVSCWLQCNVIPSAIIISPDSWNRPRLHQGTRLCELSRWQILTCTVREICYSPGRRVIAVKPWNCRLSELERFGTNCEHSAFVPIWLVFIFSER